MHNIYNTPADNIKKLLEGSTGWLMFTLNTDVYYTLAAKKPDSLIMGLENTIEQ